MTLSSGTRLGSYEIVSLLGAGGMGEVYIAEDTKLERRVALKVLAPDVADDPERRSRFEREAKAVAALNHPNIVTIYSVEEPEGVHIITMELVRGKTLTELIPKKGLPLDEFFAIAIPVSDAVSAAHQEGITHRDLKPDNVMVSGEGRPKILDFGLAKLKQNIAPTERGSKFPTKTKTQVGRIMGTAAYMSPEQAEGKAIDHRSDVFSLGIVLYEMATGRHPFPGESTVSVLSAIIKDTPTSVTEVRPTLPRDLARILRRCLAKDPEHRYQTAKDLRNELKELNEEVTSGSRIGVEQVASARQPWHGRSGLWLGASVVVLGIGILAWAILDRVETPGLPTQAIPITSLEGMERDPRLSPDGEQLAFVWNGEGDGYFHLYVKLVGGGDPLRLTGAPANDYSPAWSPDGREIAFIREGESGHEVFSIPALGGPERRLTTTAGEGLDWSPDGRFLAIVDTPGSGEPDSLYLFSIETGEKRRLTSPPAINFDVQPVFSPDGRAVAFLRLGAVSDVYVQPVEGGEARRLTFDVFSRGLDWTSDGKELVFSSLEPEAGWRLWRISVTGGEPSPLSVGENARFVSVAAAGDRLVYSQRIEDMDLWRMEGPGAAERDLPTKFPASSTRNEGWPQYSPDGTKVAFFSFRSGKPQIWVSDSDGTNATRVTPQDEIALWPRWSPSGGRIAFVLPSLGSFSAQGSFNADIYLVDTKGGIPRNLTSDGFTNSFPNWSPDERWIYYSSTRTGDWQVWKIRTEGGQPKQVTKNGGHISFAADDGRNLYYSKHAPEEGIWSVPVDGGEETHLVAKPLHLGQWCLWRRNLVYVTLDDDKGPVVEAFHLTTRETTEAGPLGPQAQDPTDVQWTWFGLTVSPDGQWILYTEARLASDLMLVENFR